MMWAVGLELGPLSRDQTVHFYPSVFLANAMAAFALNLVCAVDCHLNHNLQLLNARMLLQFSVSCGHLYSRNVRHAGGVPFDWKDKRADNEHCGSYQRLDAYFLFVLLVRRTSNGHQFAGLCVLLLWGGCFACN